MKTVQRITWIHYLFIGLIINSLFFQSCGKIRKEYNQVAEFVYVNQTNYTIKFDNGALTIIIKPKENILFKVADGANEVVNESSFKNTPKPFDTYGNYKLVYFDSLKCLDISQEMEHNPTDLKNYVAERISERTYKFTYTFTEADYNRAVTCP